ncbi:DUF3000 family protein [Bifidobacterium sp. 82T24]|uniref:DUF3000 family protein n=1 Tax=Bifidobacterium pluvialisilvae TaxID=2834436 RepID=UPI001C592D79|nr:DUF3000 family protein [Bifidobacterium pluvialisilvae]MBW3087417.1 DUF3000 family protein [Bifidobacterium pluvialisilvae]
MAEIYTFPMGVSAMTSQPSRAASSESDCGRMVPDVVLRAVDSVRSMTLRGDVSYQEIPVSANLADYGIGVRMDIADESPHQTSGWIMILYSSRPRAEWKSHWRCVAFASTSSQVLLHDSLTPTLTWDCLERMITGVEEETLGGTVSLNRDTSFGTLARYTTRNSQSGCELRVSWTPVSTDDGGLDAGSQIDVWARFLKTLTADEEWEDSISD